MDHLRALALHYWAETSQEGAIALDLNGEIVFLSAWLRDLLGLRVVPKTIDALLNQAGGAVPGLRAVLMGSDVEKETTWGRLRIMRYPPQQVTWQRVPLKDRGAVLGSLVVFRDASPQGQVEQTKQSFLSMISHDLRTPLSTILGFAELLYNGRGTLSEEEHTQFLEHIIKNANELSRYAQIALDVMYIEADMQHFDTEAVHLGRYISHWLRDAGHRLTTDRISYLNGGGDEPLVLFSPAALHRILYILVEFALAESPARAPVEIGVRYESFLAHVLVTHQAPALRSEDIPNLFRLMNPRDLSEEARPLLHRMQLDVANLLAERQHGHLTVCETQGRTILFDLALPLAEAKA